MREDTTIVRPQDLPVPPEALALLNREIAERYHVCPLALSEVRNGVRTLAVAATDPSNIMLFDQLQQVTHCRIQPYLATEQDIQRGIDVHYGQTYADAPTDLLGQMGNLEPAVQPQAQERGASSTVEAILQRAIAERASDVHIEPHEKGVYVRFRVDGVMYDHTTYELAQHPQVISRIKILAKLDISQNRLPQDGRFEIKFTNKEYDVRLSVLPATTGEKAVMRLLQKGPLAMDFDQLGITGKNREVLDSLIARPFGMILATGPTGSGKTTTLYASLAKIDCVAKNVITVEDPVEYLFPRITQLQVHPKIGMTFAAGLRSILRQDPDIIMVGEIRDLETLQIAMQSALTGHMVLSTLHCNDAAGGAARMVDMGAEPFLVSSSINGIVAQRLVRRICEKCKTEAPVSDVIRQRLNLQGDTGKFYVGKGCENCRGTGYTGRIGIYEIVPFGEELQLAIVRKASASEIRQTMRQMGIPTLLDDGLAKARAGFISLDEVMRAVFVES
ncbi:MAG TPA: GspE/PulE family protein [Armatimonadota bacterium]|jgi:type IV pilus assembly protein PilB